MTTRIERLIQQLDDSTGPSYDARAELIGIGSDAIPAIIDGLPSLGGFGQLTAIEVFEEVADPRCDPALTAFLRSDDSTVREWAAMALASLEIDGAVEPVRRAYRACLERATPPDWSEPEGIRWALTELGARPPLSRHSPRACEPALRTTPQLALGPLHRDHQRPGRPRPGDPLLPVLASGRRPHVRHLGQRPGLATQLECTWEHLVEESRTWSLLEASEAPGGDNIFVAPTWIDRTDLYPER
ncbi:HEAT repeat domain-containing protein [Streptomyces sp. H72]